MTVHDPARRWERLLPLAGPAFTVLMVAAAAAFPMPSGGDVSPASQPAWLALHHNAVIAQSYLRAVAALAFIVLVVAAAGACRRALGDRSSLPALAVVGGALSGALMLLAQSVTLAAAFYSSDAGAASTIRGLGKLQDAFLDLSSLPDVLLFAAVGAAALRTPLLPRWLAVLTLFGVPFALVDAMSYDGGPFESVGLLGLVFFLAWSLLAGSCLWLAHGQTTPTPPEPALIGSAG